MRNWSLSALPFLASAESIHSCSYPSAASAALLHARPPYKARDDALALHAASRVNNSCGQTILHAGLGAFF